MNGANGLDVGNVFVSNGKPSSVVVNVNYWVPSGRYDIRYRTGSTDKRIGEMSIRDGRGSWGGIAALPGGERVDRARWRGGRRCVRGADLADQLIGCPIPRRFPSLSRNQAARSPTRPWTGSFLRRRRCRRPCAARGRPRPRRPRRGRAARRRPTRCRRPRMPSGCVRRTPRRSTRTARRRRWHTGSADRPPVPRWARGPASASRSTGPVEVLGGEPSGDVGSLE